MDAVKADLQNKVSAKDFMTFIQHLPSPKLCVSAGDNPPSDRSDIISSDRAETTPLE
jgi:hypothetical protein